MNSPGAIRSGAKRPSAVGPLDEKLDKSPSVVGRVTRAPAKSVQTLLVTNEPTVMALRAVAGRAILSSTSTRSRKWAKLLEPGDSITHASARAAVPRRWMRQVPDA